jgi:Cu(I)/Ag(I) efflux system membrane fusion protein
MQRTVLFWLVIGLAILLSIAGGVIGGAFFHVQMGFAPAPATSSAGASVSSGHKQLYHCGMHPQIIQDHPGDCPICHMELTPFDGDENSIATDGHLVVTIDPAVVQNMGVQTAQVKKGALQKTVRTVGYLDVPENGLYEVTLKFNGYIDKLYANQTGMHVHKGDALFDVYSPEITAASEELIADRKAVDAMASVSADIRTTTQQLFAAARRKLELLDISDADIDAMAKEDRAPKTIAIHSPVTGHVEEKMIVEGSSVQAGTKLMRIEDHHALWLQAQVYEGQLPLVKVGDSADASLDAIPGKIFSGKVVFISPHLDHMTRTTSVRIELANPDLALKPGMYASVQMHATPIDDTVLVPGTAVIDTGTRQLAFVQESAGHFSPRLLTVGLAGDDDQVQVLSGLAPGETVVTSGQFLMDVESRRLEAAQKFRSATPSTMAATALAGVPETALDASSGETDAVVRAYLSIAAYLQQDHADQKPADVSALVETSNTLVEKMSRVDCRPLAKSLRDDASAMAGQNLQAQHKSFETVGAALLDLILKDPPSIRVASMLYVLNCPMENADWLQATSDIHNPFLTDMRTCGTVTKTLRLLPAK